MLILIEPNMSEKSKEIKDNSEPFVTIAGQENKKKQSDDDFFNNF